MPDFLVHASVNVTIEADNAESAAGLVRQYLDIAGPFGVSRCIDDIDIESVEVY